MQQPTRRLWKELRPYRKLLLGGMVLLFIAGPAALIPNLIWMVVVDVVLLEEQIHLLLPALAVAIVTYGFSLLCGAWRDRLFERAGQHFIHDLRGRLYSHLLQQPPSYFNNQKSGDLQSRVISDVDAVQSSLLSGFTSMVQECYTFLLVLGAIVWISPLIGASVFVPLTLAYFILRHFNPLLKNYYRDARTALGEVGARLQETIGGFPVIKIFSREDSEQQNFRALTGAHLRKTLKAVYLRTRIFPLVFSMAFTTNVIMLGLGAWLVYLGHFTLGGLVALRGFWWQLNSPVRTLAQVNDLLQRALAASSRIYALLDTPIQLPDTENAVPVKDARQPITLKNLSFAYGSNPPVLQDINLTIRPGEIIGLAGASGAGKTTLLSLLARFLAPTGGNLYLGETPIHEFQQKSWRSHLAMVFQDTFLFHTSLRENILYGRPDASMEEVQAAAQRANAQDFIADLPQGYETITGERGIKLSGGQRQRVGVARAFLANPEILLLDEPTSAVEPESERVIQESLFALMKDRTVIVSSHGPSPLHRADRVIYLEKGQIREQGTHTDLLQSNGSYARMMQQWEVS